MLAMTGRRKLPCISLWALLFILGALVHNGAYSKSRGAHKRSVDTEMANVEAALRGVTGDTTKVTEALESLKTEMKGDPNTARVEKASKILGSVGSALTKFKSNDPTQIISGCLDIVAGIATTFGGPIGLGIGAVASLISSILSLFNGGAGKNSVGAVIDRALNKHNDNELKGEAAGAKREFVTSAAYIEVLKASSNLSENTLDRLASNVPVLTGTRVLGMLEQRIMQGSYERDLSHAQRTVDFILLYFQLAIKQEALLTDLVILYQKSQTDRVTAQAIDAANQVNKETVKSSIEFLHNLKPAQALVGAVYHPIEKSLVSQLIYNYTKYFNIRDIPHELSGSYIFNNVYWKGYGICSEAYMNNYMFRSCYNVRSPNHEVEKIEKGYYTIENRQGRKVYITKHNEGWAWGTSDDDPSPQGHMIFVPLENNQWMISTEKWPDWFMYMESSASGYIRSWQYDPGPQGHWYLQR